LGTIKFWKKKRKGEDRHTQFGCFAKFGHERKKQVVLTKGAGRADVRPQEGRVKSKKNKKKKKKKKKKKLRGGTPEKNAKLLTRTGFEPPNTPEAKLTQGDKQNMQPACFAFTPRGGIKKNPLPRGKRAGDKTAARPPESKRKGGSMKPSVNSDRPRPSNRPRNLESRKRRNHQEKKEIVYTEINENGIAIASSLSKGKRESAL